MQTQLPEWAIHIEEHSHHTCQVNPGYIQEPTEN